MTTAGTKTDAVSERPLGLRRRPDLLIEPHRYGREQYWLVKDPVAARYFHLADEEHAILSMLDGQISLGQLKRRFEKTFAPLQVTVEQLYSFLGRLHSLGLLLADSFGQGEQLLQTSGEAPAAEPPRGPGQCPGDPLSRHRSGPAAAPALSQVPLGSSRRGSSRRPGLRDRCDRPCFLPIQRLARETARLSRLHYPAEHRLAVRCPGPGQDRPRAGPCPDLRARRRAVPRDRPAPAWSSPLASIATSPTHGRSRANGGGSPCRRQAIIVEAFLAAAATLLWWFSNPGVFHTLCLHIMLVCSVSTLLLNGNPLLALRRLLRARRLARGAQPRSAIAGPLESPHGRFLPRHWTAGRPFPSASFALVCWWPMPWFRPSTAGWWCWAFSGSAIAWPNPTGWR